MLLTRGCWWDKAVRPCFVEFYRTNLFHSNDVRRTEYPLLIVKSLPVRCGEESLVLAAVHGALMFVGHTM